MADMLQHVGNATEHLAEKGATLLITFQLHRCANVVLALPDFGLSQPEMSDNRVKSKVHRV